jgi:hypothetical protein
MDAKMLSRVVATAAPLALALAAFVGCLLDIDEGRIAGPTPRDGGFDAGSSSGSPSCTGTTTCQQCGLAVACNACAGCTTGALGSCSGTGYSTCAQCSQFLSCTSCPGCTSTVTTPSCTGTPYYATCAMCPENSCATAACPGCSVAPSGCTGKLGVVCGSVFGQPECDDAGCMWDPDAATCAAKASCNANSSQAACVDAGCTWSDGGSCDGGVSTPCGQLTSSAACQAVAGCTWSSTADCAGALVACTGISDMATCQSLQCTWTASTPCTGGLVSCSGFDRATCQSVPGCKPLP